MPNTNRPTQTRPHHAAPPKDATVPPTIAERWAEVVSLGIPDLQDQAAHAYILVKGDRDHLSLRAMAHAADLAHMPLVAESFRSAVQQLERGVPTVPAARYSEPPRMLGVPMCTTASYSITGPDVDAHPSETGAMETLPVRWVLLRSSDAERMFAAAKRALLRLSSDFSDMDAGGAVALWSTGDGQAVLALAGVLSGTTLSAELAALGDRVMGDAGTMGPDTRGLTDRLGRAVAALRVVPVDLDCIKVGPSR